MINKNKEQIKLNYFMKKLMPVINIMKNNKWIGLPEMTDENDNTFIINKNILGDISIKINEINKSNVNSLNNEQKINGLNNSINKNSMKEKKKLNNNKKKEAVLKTNTKNNKNNSISSK